MVFSGPMSGWNAEAVAVTVAIGYANASTVKDQTSPLKMV